MKKFFTTKPIAVDFALLILRIGFCGFMLVHGWGKLETLMGSEPIKFYNLFGMGAKASLALAVFGELVAPAFLLVGLFSRLAAIPGIIAMVVAVFGAHKDSIFGDGEHAFLYMIVFFVLLVTGPGKFSIDKTIYK